MNAKTIEAYAKLMARHGLARLKVTAEGGAVELVSGRAAVPTLDAADDSDGDTSDPPADETPEERQARALKMLLASSGGGGR
jgi:hypothetical protein